ncbi:MAG: hypothetical protein GY941_00720 [Planctomycetes bacterium]|nr:hypothetical protein [Planctomycetota bacterium]
MRILVLFFVLSQFLFITVCTVRGENYGIVTEVSGPVELVLQTSMRPIKYPGFDLSIGDGLAFSKGATITIVSYVDCREWNIKGPGYVEIKKKRIEIISGATDMVVPLRKLPFCSDIGGLEGSQSDAVSGYEMGGIVLRGKTETIESLRSEFVDGGAGNASLITLVMYDLKKKNIENARPYFEELKKRIPNSLFIKDITKYFE